jgi:outer membrane protein TolC
MVENAMRLSLDTEQLRYALVEAEQAIQDRRSALRPSLKLRAGYLWDSEEAEEGQTSDRSLQEGYAGILLSMPFFQDRFVARRELTIDRDRERMARLKIEERFRVYTQRVADDLVSAAELNARYRHALDILETGERDYELSRLRFETATIGSWDMIRSKNEFFSAQDRVAELKFALLKALSAMERDYGVAMDGSVDLEREDEEAEQAVANDEGADTEAVE